MSLNQAKPVYEPNAYGNVQGESFVQGLKKLLKSAIGAVLNIRPWRRMVTSGYQSGLLAIGESNQYRFPPRWVTIDWAKSDFPMFLTHDLKFPLPDNAFRVAFSAHLIEHIDDPTLEALLREIYRVLKPGGYVRLECPDAEFLRKAYLDKDEKVLKHFRDWRKTLISRLGMPEKYLEDQITFVGEVASYIDHSRGSGHIPVYASEEEVRARINESLEDFSAWAQRLKSPEQLASGGHNNAIYFDKLARMLTAAGFENVTRSGFGQTIIPNLVLNHPIRRLWDGIPEKPHRKFYSLYVEAKKPSV